MKLFQLKNMNEQVDHLKQLVEQRDIACQKIDGGWEIVKGYHNLN